MFMANLMVRLIKPKIITFRSDLKSVTLGFADGEPCFGGNFLELIRAVRVTIPCLAKVEGHGLNGLTASLAITRPGQPSLAFL
jgi:hypothetical protein